MRIFILYKTNKEKESIGFMMLGKILTSFLNFKLNQYAYFDSRPF